jgi:hypothetical protein
MSFKLLEEILIYERNKENYSKKERKIMMNEFRKELNANINRSFIKSKNPSIHEKFLFFDANSKDYSKKERKVIRNEFRKELNNEIF